MTIIKYRLISNDHVGHIPLQVKDRSNSLKNPQFGAHLYLPCSTCNKSYADGCRGHYGQILIAQPSYKSLVRPALSHVYTLITRYLCGQCGKVKSNSIANKIINETNPLVQTLLKEQLSAMHCVSCRPKVKKLIFKDPTFEEKSKQSAGVPIHPDKVLAWFMQIDPKFLHAIGIRADPQDLFYTNSILLMPNLYREPNYYGQNQTSDNLNVPIGKFIDHITNNNHVESTKYLKDLDNSRGSKPYAQLSQTFDPLEKQVSGADKNGLFKTYIIGKRVDQSGRAVLGPYTRGNIGNITLPHTSIQEFDSRIYHNHFTTRIIGDLLGNNKLGLKVKQLVTTKSFGAPTTYGIRDIENTGVPYGTTLPIGGFLTTSKFNDWYPVIFNRQPTLHLHSTMSAYYTFKDELVIRTPVTTQPAQNADNDGDEENFLNITTPNSLFELSFIMYARSTPINPVNSCCIFGLTQNLPIAIHMLYNKKAWTFKEVVQVISHHLITFMRKYSHRVNCNPNDSKQVLFKAFINSNIIWTGAEILSTQFDNNLTYKNIISKGVLTIPKINSKFSSAQSASSLFTLYGQYSQSNNPCDIVDFWRMLAQQYTNIYGIHATIEDLLPTPTFLSQVQKKASELFQEMNDRFNRYITDGLEKKTYISGRDAIMDMFHSLSLEYDEKARAYIKEKIFEHPSVISIMHDIGSKVDAKALQRMYMWVGKVTNVYEDIPLNINGRTYMYDIPNSLSLRDLGFVRSPMLRGLNFQEFAHVARCEAMPSSITTTCGTANAGALGKKIVKALVAYNIGINHGVVMGQKCLIPFVNQSGVHGSFLAYNELIFPNNRMNWYDDVIIPLYKRLIPSLMDERYTTLYKVVIFICNIDLEIHTFINTPYESTTETDTDDIMEYTWTPFDKFRKRNIKITPDEALGLIEKFVEHTRVNQYFGLVDMTCMFYLIVTHLNPHVIGKDNLTMDLYKYIFGIINYRLKYCAEVGTPVGIQYGMGIQEVLSQTSLSSFHQSTKGGRVIQTNIVDKIKMTLELGGKTRSQQIQIISPYLQPLQKIQSILTCIRLADFNPIIHRDENLIIFIINKEALLKSTTIASMFNIIMDGLSHSTSLGNTFWMDVEIKETEIEFTVGMDHTPNADDELDIKWDIELLTNVNTITGHPLNSNIQIDQLDVYAGYKFIKPKQRGEFASAVPHPNWKEDYDIPTDGNAPRLTSKVYELTITIMNINALEAFNLRHCKVILPITHVYTYGGMDILQDTIVQRIISDTGDQTLSLAIQFVANHICKSYTPAPIKTLKNMSTVLQAALHGDSKAITNACVRNTNEIDNEPYTRIMLGKPIPTGTGFYQIYLNLATISRYSPRIDMISDYIKEQEDVEIAPEF